MTKVRVVYRPDGGISVIHPVSKSRRANESEEQWLERVLDKATPFGIDYKDIDKSELPQVREDREAWTGTKNERVYINQVKKQQLEKEKKEKQLIKDKKAEILDRLALEELIAEGKL